MNLQFNVLLFFWLAFAAGTSAQLTDIIGASETQLANISFRLQTGQTIAEYTSELIENASNLIPKLNVSRPTVMYIPGWTETPDKGSAEIIVPAYLARQDHNVIVVDWQEIAAGSYPFAAASASDVGSTIAEGLNELVAAGLNSSTLHVVSHSLGSQVAGFVGRNVNFVLPRITGLDPAGPGFYIVIEELRSTDAGFVDIIHTDALAYGTGVSEGTVDFHPNGGSRVQPGCPLVRVPATVEDFCDHRRSYHFYAESLSNENAFIGVKCNSWTLVQLGLCNSNEKVVMGYATPITAKGNFYLQTNSGSPFSRGSNGAIYSPRNSLRNLIP